MKKDFYNIIFIAWAPWTGKSSVAKLLQKEFSSPCFEFGWIPEFRNKWDDIIPYEEEEWIAFENLVLVTKNYIKHGFTNIILTDLEDHRIKEIHKHFPQTNYILFTFTVCDNEVLKSRVMNESRSSEYRDWESAVDINQNIISRSLLPKEIRIDTTKQSIEDVVGVIKKHLKN